MLQHDDEERFATAAIAARRKRSKAQEDAGRAKGSGSLFGWMGGRTQRAGRPHGRGISC